MRQGKASHAVMDRCVRRPLQKMRESMGNTCSALPAGLVSAGSCGGIGEKTDLSVEMYAADLMNRLLAEGADPEELSACLMFPADSPEEPLKELVERLCAFCTQQGLAIRGVYPQVNAGILSPQIALTMWGCRQDRIPGPSLDLEAKRSPDGSGILPADCDLIMIGPAGRAGTAVLAFSFEEELAGRFPLFLVRSAMQMGRDLSLRKEALAAWELGAVGMQEIGEGGIFAALWELGEKFAAGLDVDLKKIPIRQETIEICEHLDLNPYQLNGTGAMLILAEDGKAMVKALAENEVSAWVIGRTTSLKSRIIRNGEETRYLEKPQQDMLFQLRSRGQAQREPTEGI